MVIFISGLFLGCGIQSSVFAQSPLLTDEEKELYKQAEESMGNEDYEKALRLYSQLLSLYTDDVVFRYKYAACLIQLNRDIEKAVEYLNIAKSHAKSEIPQIYYYLGQAFHQRYMFDQAIRYYTKFNPDDVRRRERDKFPVQRQILMANNGKKLIRYAYKLDVVNKKNLNRSNFYYAYDMDGIGGEFVKKHPSLQTRYDSKHENNPIAFISDANDKLMFSSYGKRGDTGKDIYFADRQPDGTWGEPYKLEHPINTNEDEDYPFLHPDGKHLYFSSKGHNSMGGYDLFVSKYNESTGSWGVPQNLDFPVNSPLDDILYVTDSVMDYAIFTSNRNAEGDRLIVYTIKIKKEPEKHEIENIQDLRNISKLELSPLADQMKMRDESTKEIKDRIYERKPAQDKKEDILPSDKYLAKYLDLRETVESDFNTMDKLSDEGDKKLNKFKHSVIDAEKSGDTKFMLDAAEILHIYRQQLNNLKSDIKELHSSYNKLPEQPDKNNFETLMNELQSIHNSNQRIIEQYKNIDILADLENKLGKQIKNMESNKEKLARIEKEMEQNLEKVSGKNGRDDEELQALQNELKNQYIQLAYEVSLDSLKMRDTKTQIKHARTILSNLYSKPTDTITLPERKISEVSFEFRKERIKNLSEKREQIQEYTNKKYTIEPWYENEAFKESVEQNLSQARLLNDQIPQNIINRQPKLAQKVSRQKKLVDDANALRNQISKEKDESKIRDLYEELNRKIEELKTVNQEVSAFMEEDVYASDDTKVRDNTNISNNRGTRDTGTENDTETKVYEKDISDIYTPDKITVSTENIRKSLSESDEEPPESTDVKIRYYKNNIEEKSNRVVEVHQGYYTQLKTAFNTLKGKDEIANQTSIIQNAENLMEDAEGLRIAADNQKDRARTIALYEKAEQKALQANQLLNEAYKKNTGKPLIEFTTPDLPSASEYKAFENKQIEKLTAVEDPEENIKMVDGGYTVQLKEEILEKTDSLARADETMDARLASTPNKVEKIHLTTEKDIINYTMGGLLNKLIYSEVKAMDKRMKDNNEKLQALSEMGKIDEYNIPEIKTDEFIPIENQDISPSLRKQQMAAATDLFVEKMDIIAKQEKLLNSLRRTPREPLLPEWYDIQSKLINRKYNRPPDEELTDALSAWDVSDANNLPYNAKQKNNLVEIRSEKQELEANIKNTEREIENIKNKSWSESKIQKQVNKLSQSLYSYKLELQDAEYRELKQILDVQKDMTKAPSTQVEKTADQIADSLESIANRTYRLMNIKEDLSKQECTKILAYATGLLKEVNNLWHLRNRTGENANQMLEKLIGHYRGKKPIIIAEASTDDLSNRTNENEPLTETRYDQAENDWQTRHTDTQDRDEVRRTEQDTKDRIIREQEDRAEETDFTERNFFYRIQIAALVQPLQGNCYRDLSPVVNEQVQNRSLYRYLVGKFYNKQSWQQPLSLVRRIGFSDAFVVGYLEGRRLTLSQARQYSHLETNKPPEFNYYGDQRMLAQEDTRQPEYQTETPTGETVIARNINEILESFFTIQIGVFSRVKKESNILGISTDFYNRTSMGNLRYFHGKYATRSEAIASLNTIRNTIPDAFVTLHVGGRPMSSGVTRESMETAEEAAARLDIPVIREEIEVDPADTTDVTPEIRIQIGAFVGKMDNEMLVHYKNVFSPYRIVIMRKGRFHYYQLTGFENYAVAKYALRRLVKPEVPDAFFTAYRGNVKIPVRQAMLIIKID
ncbi:MAG: hypothetical protein ACP5DZ_06570 [Bacteroidales bacterium]